MTTGGMLTLKLIVISIWTFGRGFLSGRSGIRRTDWRKLFANCRLLPMLQFVVSY